MTRLATLVVTAILIAAPLRDSGAASQAIAKPTSGATTAPKVLAPPARPPQRPTLPREAPTGAAGVYDGNTYRNTLFVPITVRLLPGWTRMAGWSGTAWLRDGQRLPLGVGSFTRDRYQRVHLFQGTGFVTDPL